MNFCQIIYENLRKATLEEKRERSIKLLNEVLNEKYTHLLKLREKFNTSVDDDYRLKLKQELIHIFRQIMIIEKQIELYQECDSMMDYKILKSFTEQQRQCET